MSTSLAAVSTLPPRPRPRPTPPSRPRLPPSLPPPTPSRPRLPPPPPRPSRPRPSPRPAAPSFGGAFGSSFGGGGGALPAPSPVAGGGGGVDFSGARVRPDGKRCVQKQSYVETIEKDPILECSHKNVEKCHYTYVTEFEANQEEVCNENFEKKCQITFNKQAVSEKVKKCYRPQKKVCNGYGPEECRTVYESSCSTKYVEKHPGKFVADTKCKKLPIKERISMNRTLAIYYYNLHTGLYLGQRLWWVDLDHGLLHCRPNSSWAGGKMGRPNEGKVVVHSNQSQPTQVSDQMNNPVSSFRAGEGASSFIISQKWHFGFRSAL